jgi:hypothetical protein
MQFSRKILIGRRRSIMRMKEKAIVFKPNSKFGILSASCHGLDNTILFHIANE